MFRSFIAWLDAYLVHEEPAAVLKALAGLLAFAGLLGTIFGSQAIRAGAFVATILFALCAILLLVTDRRRLQRELDISRTLLARYADFIIDNKLEPLVSIEEWAQKVFVQPNGDVREVVTINAVALREEIYFLRLHAGSEWDQPERYRKGLTVRARSIKNNGVAGPHWIVTNTWLSADKLNSIVHFQSPIRRVDEFRLEMKRFWPAKCLPLMRGHIAERFTFRTTELIQIQQMRHSLVLPAGFDAVYEPIGFTEPHNHLCVESDIDDEGRRVIVFRATQLPKRRTVGFRLELA